MSGNVSDGNGYSNNGQAWWPPDGAGFVFADSSNNTVEYNEASHNGAVGFHVYFASQDNTFSYNQGCHNYYFDAGDGSSGTGNTWTNNDFCVTQGI